MSTERKIGGSPPAFPPSPSGMRRLKKQPKRLTPPSQRPLWMEPRLEEGKMVRRRNGESWMLVKEVRPFGDGSKLNHQGTAGIGPCFHLPGSGYIFLPTAIWQPCSLVSQLAFAFARVSFCEQASRVQRIRRKIAAIATKGKPPILGVPSLETVDSGLTIPGCF